MPEGSASAPGGPTGRPEGSERAPAKSTMTSERTAARVATGIDELDRRVDGLRPGGLYVLSSPPGHARRAAVLQFAAAGLADGGRVALVTRSKPDRLLGEAEDYGLSLHAAWEEGRLTLLGFRGEYEMRLRRAGSPEEVFRELASLMEPVPPRLVFDPGSPLWEGRGDGATAHAFVDFLEETGATCLATTTTALDGGLSAATELVTQAATGLFELDEGGEGLVRLRILKLEPGGRAREEVTLSLVAGEGLTGVGEAPARRHTDVAAVGQRRALLLPLEAPLPEELASWLRARYEVDDVGAPLDLVARLQEDRSYGLVLMHLDRERLSMGLRACRVCRRLRPELSVIVLSGDAIRARDRAKLLRAGADECLTGRVNVEELASRLELVRTRGRPHPGPTDGAEDREDGRGEGREAEDGGEADAGGEAEDRGGTGAAEAAAERPDPLDADAFRTEVRRLLEADGSRVFTVLRFRCGERADELLEHLTRIVRAEAGDRVAPLDGECAVLLPDTRPVEAQAFLERAREELSGALGESPEAEVLGGVRDGPRLQALLG